MLMQTMLSASQSISRMQTMQSTQTKMQNTATILHTESKLQKGGNKKKDDQANEMEQKSNELMGDLMQEATKVNETIRPDEETKEADAKAEEEKRKAEAADLTLSDPAAKYGSENPHTKAAALEPVIYKADGSVVPSSPVKSNTTFNKMI